MSGMVQTGVGALGWKSTLVKSMAGNTLTGNIWRVRMSVIPNFANDLSPIIEYIDGGGSAEQRYIHGGLPVMLCRHQSYV
ncbi:hypothetical protein HA48_04795 [Pantoea wallisii]|uniref:Uncharacterized protein n=1 Tax=Pantoea wallisii TaxID=1076551 RepID=A0A1X1DCN7_9GAMM|nr:hypothetical protein HA48_04795 [Pantoea wallisii]